MYITNSKIPFTKIGLLGYSKHGKTTYTLSLLRLLRSLNQYWDNFILKHLMNITHETAYHRVNRLMEGKIPATTQPVYPRPVFLRLNNILYFDHGFVSIFDTGGKFFKNIDLMTREGRYFARTDVLFFL